LQETESVLSSDCVMEWLCGCCGRGDSEAGRKVAVGREAKMDEKWKGEEVVVEGEGYVISGQGTVLGEAPLVQGKTYFEVTVKKMGLFGVGLASRNVDLSQGMGVDEYSWAFVSDKQLVHNRESDAVLGDFAVDDGDVVGCAYDHTALSFYYNGRKMEQCYYTVRGRVFPAVCVSQGAILHVNLGQRPFQFPPPPNLGFQGVMFETSLI
jgi:hypothetical protein